MPRQIGFQNQHTVARLVVLGLLLGGLAVAASAAFDVPLLITSGIAGLAAALASSLDIGPTPHS